MPVPTYDHFIEPLLRYLATRPEGAPTADAHEAVAARLGLSPEECDERLPSGVQPVYKNRNGWAQDRLKRAGLSSSPRYGFWKTDPRRRGL
jgi:restriction system protein